MFAKASVRDWLTLSAVAVGAGVAGYKLLAGRVSVLVRYTQGTGCFRLTLALLCRGSVPKLRRSGQKNSTWYAYVIVQSCTDVKLGGASVL